MAKMILPSAAINRLQKRPDVKVGPRQIYIHINHKIGLKGWSHIDYLKKLGFKVRIVKSLNDV